VLMRAGHTEAGCDLAQLAGCEPAAVICEIMKDDGSMARLPDLVTFAQRHGLKLGTIADLIAHRRRTERMVKRVEEGSIRNAIGGEWKMYVYESSLERGEHLALVKGDISGPEPVLARMHAGHLLNDLVVGRSVFELHAAMEAIAAEGRGVVVILRDWRRDGLSSQLRAERLPSGQPMLRDYGIGAQILADLGVTDIIRLSNHPRPLVGLEGWGLRVVETRPLAGEKQR